MGPFSQQNKKLALPAAFKTLANMFLTCAFFICFPLAQFSQTAFKSPGAILQFPLLPLLRLCHARLECLVDHCQAPHL